MNDELVRTVHDLGARLSGSILSVPAAEQVEACESLVRLGAGIHLDLIDGRYPLGAGISSNVVDEILQRWPALSDVHLMASTRELDVLDVRRIGRLTVHLEPEVWRDVDLVIAHTAQELWISIEPHLWDDAALQSALRAVRPAGVLMMLAPPGDPRFGADLDLLSSSAWAEARASGPLGVDGGVAPAQVPAIVDAGARYVVLGRALFGKRRMASEEDRP